MELHFKQFPEQVEALIDKSNSLAMALKRLEQGTKPTVRSWFYENKSPEWILGTVTAKLKSVSKDLQFISEWDISKSEKFAAQGGSAPLKQRLDKLDEYFSHNDAPHVIKDLLWVKAKQIAIQRLGFNGSGSPISLQEVVSRGVSEDKYNTNSGFPDYAKRKNPEVIANAIAMAPHCIENKDPATLGTRASMGKTGVDARSIFMAAMDVNIWGQRYQEPLQDYIRSKKIDFFTPWEGWDSTQAAISHSWNNQVLKFGADYSKMDQHFNMYHGLEVFSVIQYFFKPTYRAELKEIIQYVFNVPIITNLGYIDQLHSMPSGSEWTNFLETMWNYIFTIYLELKYHLKFSAKFGIGDDQLWLLQGNWTPRAIEWITDTVVREFDYCGLPGNREKQEVSLTITGFLQRLLSSNWNGPSGTLPAAGVYSLIRNVTSQVYPEFYHNSKLWNSDMFALRCIMIAENCVQHPLFKWYVQDFLANANPAILKWVRKSDSELVETQRQARHIANFMPTYNQEKQHKSILSFETVKLLRSIK